MISSQVHYDSFKQCYMRIFTIDRQPKGPLASMTRALNSSKLSPFQENSPCCNNDFSCVRAIYSNATGELYDMREQSVLITFILQNGYTIDTELTKLLQNNRVKDSNNRQLMYVIKYD